MADENAGTDLRAMAYTDPEIMFAKLEEDSYKAEVKLLDRYQSFAAELARLSLLGIAGFGFYLKEIWDPKERNVPKEFELSLVLFGISVITALLYRYQSSDALRSFLLGLRSWDVSKERDAKKWLQKRYAKLRVCVCLKAVSAGSLALAAGLLVLGFISNW